MRINCYAIDSDESARVCVCVRVRIRTRTHTHAHLSAHENPLPNTPQSIGVSMLWGVLGCGFSCLLGVRCRADK